MILEALLHLGPLTISTIGEKVDACQRLHDLRYRSPRSSAASSSAPSDAEDRRVRLVALTCEGRGAHRAASSPNTLEDMEAITKDISQQERQVLYSALKKIGFRREGCNASATQPRSSGHAAKALGKPNWQVTTASTKGNIMLTIRKSNERGHADHGWLDSHHTFSFANYYDPAHMGFRSLRVINEDRVAEGRGFGCTCRIAIWRSSPTSSPANSPTRTAWVTSRSSAPTRSRSMSAGSGVVHSEFNGSDTEPAHFFPDLDRAEDPRHPLRPTSS